MEIPAEGTPAGDTLAVMMALAPATSIILGSTVRPKLLAFVAAIVGSGAIIGVGTSYALSKAPGSGTEFAASVFASIAGGLSLFMATVTAGGRALLFKTPPAADAEG